MTRVATPESAMAPILERKERWPSVSLRDVCAINPRRRIKPVSTLESLVSFVPMSAVDARSGEIVEHLERPFDSVKKGFTYLENGDVIFAKITPCMQNGKHAVCNQLINGFGFGSTEFHVIRPSDDLSPEWLHHFLRQKEVLKEAENHFTGAVGQQRVPEAYLAGLKIPLPPIDEQRRVASRLAEALAATETVRRLTEERLATAKALAASCLRDVFEGQEGKCWVRVTVEALRESGALVEHQDGNHGELHPRNRDFVASGVRFVTAKHIGQNGELELLRAPFISHDQASSLRIGFAKARDILLAHNASVGPLAMAPPDCDAFVVGTSLTIYRANGNDLDQGFLYLALRSEEFQRQLLDAMKQTTRNQVPITRQRELKLPFPPVAVQRAVAAVVSSQLRAADALVEKCTEDVAGAEALPASLLRSVFMETRAKS